MDLVHKSFISPSPQAALDGAEGLTHVDIAKSLGIRADNFKTRFYELGYDKLLQQLGLNFTIIQEKSDGRGRPKEVLVFPTEVARILVANYPNEIGIGYAFWLVAQAHDYVALLSEDNMQLRNDLYRAQANQKKPRQKALPKPKRAVTMSLSTTLFGPDLVDTKKPLAEMTSFERFIAKAGHILDVVRGQKLSFDLTTESAAGELFGRMDEIGTDMTLEEVAAILKKVLFRAHADRHREEEKK